MTTKHTKYYAAVSVSLATFGVYLAALKNDFIGWDDSTYVVDNPHIRTFNFAFLKWAFLDFYASNWHPLTWLSHALDYAVWGLNPLGHHLTNNILHAVNTFLVVLMVVKLIEQRLSSRVAEWSSSNDSTTQQLNSSSSPLTVHDLPAGRQGSRFTLIAATVTGLLFGLHPLHVESVAWVAERKDLLCAFFYLLSVMAYINYIKGKGQGAIGDGQGEFKDGREAIGERKRAIDRYYLFSLCFFIFALLSKPMAVSLPVVLLILDWYPFQRITSFKTFRSSLTEKIPFIALSIGLSIVTMMAQEKAMILNYLVPWQARVLVAARAIFVYLGKMLLPMDLSPFYPYSGNVFLLSPGYFLPLILLIGLTAALPVISKRHKVWLSVWVYYVVTLVPVLGIVQVGRQSMADRYTYLPSIGPFFIAGLFAAWAYRKASTSGRSIKLACIVLVLLLAILMSFLTYKQIGVWNNAVGLWNYVIQKEPEKVPFAYYNRGVAFYREGQMDRAIEDYSKAIALDPSYSRAYANRGFIFEKIGQPDKAIADYDRAIALNPLDAETLSDRGAILEKAGELDRAVADYDKVIALSPGESQAYNNRGVVFEKMGRLDRAIADYDKAIALNSSNADLYYNRGNAYDALGRADKAIPDFDMAIALNPRDSQAYNNRGLVFEKVGELDKAIRDYDKAVALDPSNAEAYNNRLSALGKKSGGPAKQGLTVKP